MAERAWISQVKNLFVKSPLVSNVCFGFLLTVLEKLVEMEFVCPCDSKWNIWFTAAFFIVPAVLVFLLMINIQGYKTKKEWEKHLLFSIVPAMVWIILMFFDGRYFACLMTDWSGTFVIAPETAPKKWCKPANFSSSSGDKLEQTLLWYSHSQVIGMVFVICITLGIYVIIMCRKEQQKTEDSPRHVEGHQDPEASTHLTVNEDTT